MIEPTAPPLPSRAIISERWSDLVFLHWRIDPSRVAPLLPPGTRPDVHDGSAWVGLVPFVMRDHAFPPGPAIPYLGTFVEINVRTYSVDDEGHRGVVFASLEAERLLAVLAARALFGLPYFWARARLHRDPDRRELGYTSRRLTRHGPRTRLSVRLDEEPVDDELAVFLTARWGFHQRVGGKTIWAPNHHRPWPLVTGELTSLDDDLLAAAGFADLSGRPPDSVLATPFADPGVLTRFAAPRALRS